tara:strand:- start:688 stop:1611 length:924 start_codon:yes stop_codon:yes gene_type:complete
MKVALFGATGFVGSYILDELISRKFKPQVMVRHGSDSKLFHRDQCKQIVGNINDENAIEETIKGCDAVIYNIGIIREFPKNGQTFEALHFQGAKRCIDIAKKLNLSRFILMTANGVKVDGTGYQKTKLMAEEYLKWSELDYTIFRPSLIFGDPRGDRPEFCTQLKKDMLSLPFPAPNFHTGLNPFNAGEFSMSPIHVKDVAKIFVQSLSSDDMIKKVYHIGGEEYSWIEIINTITSSYGKTKWTVPAPVFVIKIVASFLDRFSWFPVTKDQISMLVEGNVCKSEDLFKICDILPIPFNSESLSYLKN